MASTRRWRLVPHLLLRRAGFPFELIEGLRSGAGPAAREAGERAIAADSIRERLLRTRFPAEVARLAQAQERAALKLVSAWRHKVGRRIVAPTPTGPFSAELVADHASWCELQAQADRGRSALEALLGSEPAELARRVGLVLAHPQVRDALFLLVPQVLDAVDSAGPVISDAALLRRLYLFIQRLASKNETTSFFGPLTHARVDPDVPQTTFGPETPDGVHRREAFVAFWAAAALGTAAAIDPELRPLLAVRRIGAASVEGERAWGPDGLPVELEASARALYAQVDGTRTLPAMAAMAGQSAEQAEAALRALERAGFVRRDLEPSSTDHHPLEDVRRRLPDGPAGDRWRARLDAFNALLRRFEEAGLAERRTLLPRAEEQFQALTGKSAKRGAGQMYADRTVLFEDCEGDLQPTRLSSQDAALIEDALAPALELGATYGRLRHRALVTLATEVLGGRPRVRFLQFAEELDQRIARGGLSELDQSAHRWLGELQQRVAAASTGSVSRLEPAALHGLVDDAGPRFASPDVMLCRTPEGLKVVIGEVHPYVFGWGSQNYFAPDAEALSRAFSEDLSPWGGRERMAVVLRRRKHKGLVSQSFPGTFVEVTARSVEDPSRRVAIGDLHVRAGPEGAPVLVGPRGELTLYVGEDDHPHLRVFAPALVEMPPIRLGAHTPRVELGRLVLQRERWEVPSEAGGIAEARDLPELLLRAARTRTELGWPRFVFAGAPSEPKPVCLDLEVSVAAQHLQRLLAQGPVRVIEMLPGPEQLWLQRSRGGFTSELRLGMLRRG